MRESNNSISNVRESFNEINQFAISLNLCKQSFLLPSGGHLQGVQKLVYKESQLIVISGSSKNESYFLIGDLQNDGEILHYEAISNEPFRHAGGIQIIGDILAVGIEDNVKKDKSKILFFDLTNPFKPNKLQTEILRSGLVKRSTAGAVGIVKLASHHLVAVGTWNSASVDFYISNGRSINSQYCTFKPISSWDNKSADKSDWIDDNWASYQGINLLQERNGNIYLIGFGRNTNGEDWMDLYFVNLNSKPDRILRKIGKKHVYCENGTSFRWGGGVSMHSSEGLFAYAIERKIDEETTINIFRQDPS